MAIVYFSYLFDIESFLKEMSPLIPDIDNGNYTALFKLARTVIEAKPDLWDLLDDLFLGPPFIEEDEEPTSQRLLTIILMQYLQPIPTFKSEWKLLRYGLPLVGWSDQDTDILLFGRSLCTLLSPERKHRSNRLDNNQKEPIWCEAVVNWLDLSTIERFRHQLEQSRDVYFALTQQPQAIKTILSGRLSDNGEIPIQWYSDGLISAYSDMMRILTTASEARKALAMAIT